MADSRDILIEHLDVDGRTGEGRALNRKIFVEQRMEYDPHMRAVGRPHQIIIIGREEQIVTFHGTAVCQLKVHIDLRPLRPVNVDLRAGVIAARGQRQRLDQLQARFILPKSRRRHPYRIYSSIGPLLYGIS